MRISFKMILFGVLLLAGCQTTSGTVNTQYTSYFNLEPPRKNQKFVYIQVQDGTGTGMDLESRISKQISKRGYTITKYPERANYVLQANVIHAGDIDTDVLEYAYKTSYGSRITKSTPKEDDLIAKGLNKLIGSAAAKSKGIILDLKVTEWQNKGADRKRIGVLPKKTRIVSGVTGRNLDDSQISGMSTDVVQKIASIF